MKLENYLAALEHIDDMVNQVIGALKAEILKKTLPTMIQTILSRSQNKCQPFYKKGRNL